MFLLPTATTRFLGAEKWGVGPTVVLQPFVSYTTSTHTTIGINTESTYDWAHTKWTVPINPFVSQVLKIGPQPISLQLGPKIYAAGPTSAPDWGFRFNFVLLFPM